ncbi:L,D-transpeptidase [Sphingopyxis sp. QXT-31]|uniref:L,D-transpeptidase family protein n=1 Tax=Sphingopyxis sp. QXT-31 TaxID=1357916 RepID=UPI00097911E9|nr:L,D-transpeptidase family protein [Sphingopyxis sp. QXT-31]APZ98592.1 L,D-transpeptidase [Sphingopyxis sp. QXT-31]
MVKISPIAAPLILPLALAASPALAQTNVKEDSVVLQPDKVVDDAPEIESAAEANLPSWSKANAEALLRAIESAGAEGLFAKDYNPEGLAAAIIGDDQAHLDRVATDSFLLLATHLRDGRTPNAARKQWFMTDSDADSMPLVSMLTAALVAGTIPETLAGFEPTHANFAALKAALANAKTTADANAIRVNMERWRWMPRDLGPTYIVTNVPEYQTRVIYDGVKIGEHKAVVGKPSTATPQLNPMATGVIVNPTWTLPRSIINEGIGATIARNPAAARAQGYTWTGSGKTLSVVQKAGANNALGVMKLEMLNPHAIYLHDTPSQGAFASATRAFSHGCIRTEKALKFSGLMTVWFAGKTPEEFGEAIASGETTRFGFEKPFPVYIAYWTAIPGEKGGVKKLADIYGRDAPVIASFAKPGRPAATMIAPPVVPTVASKADWVSVGN